MQQLNTWKKSAYGAGTIVFAVKDAAFVNFVMFYYTQVLGVSGTLAGLAGGIAVLSDAISDPIIGSWSDHHRSPRWGRRHPFMASSGIPLAICFILIFSPPAALGEIGNFIWLTLFATALRTFLTIFHIPYTALGAELSQDYEERSMIANHRSVWGWVAGIALPAIAYVFIFVSAGESDGRLIAPNYTNYAILSAGLVLLGVMVATASTLAEIPRLPSPPENPQSLSFTAPYVEMREALGNRNFRWLFAGLVVAGGIGGIAITLSPYVNTYFWEFTTEQMAVFAVPMLMGSILAFAAIGPLGRRYEKRSILLGSILALLVNGFWWIPLRLMDLLPENGDPILLWGAAINVFFLVLCLMISQVMGASIVADIVDEYELETSERREGVFFAALGFSSKSVSGLGMLIGGVIIDLVGLPTGAEPGTVAQSVLFPLGLIAGPILTLFFLIPVAMMSRVSLSRVRHDVIRAQLDERAARSKTEERSPRSGEKSRHGSS
jgi:GPH family glycoside/pentoside/hexuronide:cation symporter